MQIKPIHSEQDYHLALKRCESLMDAEPDTEQGDELEILSTLLQAYEKSHHTIDDPNPIDAIRFRMEQAGLRHMDLEVVLSVRSNRVYELLNRSRPLTLGMIRKLSQDLHIPANVLIQEYDLKA